MRRFAVVLLLGMVVVATGCSKSEDIPPVTQAPPAAAPKVDPPDVAVRQFLEAIRTGDHKQAEAMLTDLARQKTAEADLMVAPPGSPTAKFEIAEMQIVDNQVAHVATVWTDIGDDGKPQSSEFAWALRLEPMGWRIAGVAVQLFPNQPPLLLDFEDPADMQRKTQMAEAEAQKQMNAAQNGTQNMQAGGAINPSAGVTGGVVPTGATTPAAAMPGTGNEPALLQGAAPQPNQLQR